MKIMKKNPKRQLLFSLLFFVIGTIGFWKFANHITDLFYLSWLALGICFILLVISKDNCSSTFNYRWLGKIWIFQLGIFGIYLGIQQVIYSLFPVFFKNSIPTDHKVVTLLLHYGLFPWPLITLFSVVLMHYVHQKTKWIRLRLLINPLTKKSFDSLHALIIEGLSRTATFLAIVTSGVFITLLLISLLIPEAWRLTLYNYQVSVLLTTALLLTFLFSKKITWHITRFCKNLKQHTYGIALIFIAILTGLLFLSALLFHNVHTAMPIPFLLQKIYDHNGKILQNLFSLSSWSLWIPVGSLWIVSISQDKKIRDIIMATLSLPLLFGTGVFLQHRFLLIHWPNLPLLDDFLAFLSFIIVIYYLTNRKQLETTIQGLIRHPAKNNSYRSRSYGLALLYFMGVYLVIYLPTGLALVTVFNIMVLMPLFLYFFAACVFALLNSCTGIDGPESPLRFSKTQTTSPVDDSGGGI